MHPEQVPERLEELRPYMTEICEVSLADWQDNPNSGAWVKFRLPDESHLEIYRGKNRAGRTQKFGQRYQMILIEINDDETPMQAPESKPRKLSQIAGGLCHDEKFRNWLEREHGDPFPTSEHAAQFIRDMCGVESRSYLDTNEAAAAVFRTMLSDYDAFQRGNEG